MVVTQKVVKIVSIDNQKVVPRLIHCNHSDTQCRVAKKAMSQLEFGNHD